MVIRTVNSDQIGHKCDQIFTDAIVFEHALAICDWKICQLVAKQHYCDRHTSLKTICIFGYFSKFKN